MFLPPFAYLKQIARNLITDRFRTTRRAQSHLDQAPSQESPSPEEDWLNQALIQELMAKLPPDYRQTIELRIIQGYSHKETAALMGRSEDAIRGLQYRALQALRDLMRNNEQKGGAS
ncbi:MAG: RNA polymerase sigma factor [Desulfitobacterium sp.]